jgi:hypothetical protein
MPQPENMLKSPYIMNDSTCSIKCCLPINATLPITASPCPPSNPSLLKLPLRAAGVGREVADPGGGAEVQASGAVKLDGPRVVANVEDIAVAVVAQESGRILGVELRAAAKPSY